MLKFSIKNSVLLIFFLVGCNQLKEAPLDEYLDRCLTPPAFLRQIDQITIDVVASLNEAGITYWLDSGTLLGAYRFASHMPFDDDADLGILRSDYEHKKGLFIKSIENKGYDVRAANVNPSGDHIPQVYFRDRPNDRPHLDLFMFEPVKDSESGFRLSSKYWNGEIKGPGFNKNMIFGEHGQLGKAWLLGHEYHIPYDTKAYLAQWYGSSDLLVDFYVRQNHSGGYCETYFARAKDITRHSHALNKMFKHLEETYGKLFDPKHSKLFQKANP